ncbi:MAG: hypothetical protein OXL68_04995 [Paracoccaceae bacterium]|nr:hypothetical protein [Paracoccaceae bacterium]
MASELKTKGTTDVAFIEIWGSVVPVDENLVCISPTGNALWQIINEVKETRERLSGFPDVLALFSDGRIAFREIKKRKGESIKPKQRAAADFLRKMFGSRAELAIVEWARHHVRATDCNNDCLRRDWRVCLVGTGVQLAGEVRGPGSDAQTTRTHGIMAPANPRIPVKSNVVCHSGYDFSFWCSFLNWFMMSGELKTRTELQIKGHTTCCSHGTSDSIVSSERLPSEYDSRGHSANLKLASY